MIGFLRQMFERTGAVRLAGSCGRRRAARVLASLAPEPWSPAIIQDFVTGAAGRAYNVREADKVRLVEQFRRTTREILSGASPLVHVILAREILSIPPEISGDVVECGVWKGASAASLSLVCRLVNRRLWVCDSFEGLPDDGETRHTGLHTGVYGHYKAGMFSGALDEVKRNIRRCGCLDVCEFAPGFFADSLKRLSGPLVFAFLDVDLVESTRDCLKRLWPLLTEKGLVYTDDAGDLEVVKVFFDGPWWQDTLGCPAPGYVGSGCGLPLNPRHSSIGYTRKVTQFDEKDWQRAPFLHYPDDEGNPEAPQKGEERV